MQKILELLDSRKRSSADSKLALAEALQSTLCSGDISVPVSPVASLFSHKRHSKVSSSFSSVTSLPSMGNSMEGSFCTKLPLGNVTEEPIERQCPAIEDDYFQHFDHPTSQPRQNDLQYSVREHDGYAHIDVPHSPKKRHSEDQPSTKGSPHSWVTPWKLRNGSASALTDSLASDPRSRASSTSSKLNVSLTGSQLSQRLGKALSVSTSNTPTTPLLDTGKANLAPEEDMIPPKPGTPLLPPVISAHSTHATNSPILSPLQSPSVADVTDELNLNSSVHQGALVDASPALSTKPSISSLGRQRANTLRKASAEAPFPLTLIEKPDPWADRLGHANFTILPEPYAPFPCDSEAIRQFHMDWNAARGNYMKHLVRTGEHYGATSKIYHLTQKKWEEVEAAWMRNHGALIASLDGSTANKLGLTRPPLPPVDTARVPRLHDNDKFPELGDTEIVGLMSVAPAMCISTRRSSPQKRSFFRLVQDLVGKGQTPKIDATRA